MPSDEKHAEFTDSSDDRSDGLAGRSVPLNVAGGHLRVIWRRLATPFAFIERSSERLARTLQGWAFLDVLQSIAHLGVLVAVISYVVQIDDRRRAGHYQAWRVINSAQGKAGNGGRIDALQELNADAVSLRGVDAARAFLDGIQLPQGRLGHARLDSASLSNANFEDADLSFAGLHAANLRCANFHGARLSYADLSNVRAGNTDLSRAGLRGANVTNAFLFAATLENANLFEARIAGSNQQKATLQNAQMSQTDARGAIMVGTQLRGAHLRDASLVDARLHGSDLSSTDLTGADVSGATLLGSDLSNANLENLNNWRRISSLYGANLYGVKNAPEGFVTWAVDTMGAVQVASFDEWVEIAKRAITVEMFRMTAFAEFNPGRAGCD